MKLLSAIVDSSRLWQTKRNEKNVMKPRVIITELIHPEMVEFFGTGL